LDREPSKFEKCDRVAANLWDLAGCITFPRLIAYPVKNGPESPAALAAAMFEA
jgi:hypothetical protein